MTDLAATIPFPELHVVERVESLDVVVCCASEKAELALGTFATLVGERLLPRLVGGLEVDVEPLVDAIARASGPTLFVLCVGKSIGGARTRQLVETFTARRAPLHRLLVLEVDHDRSEALSASIVLGAQGMRRRLGPRGLRHSEITNTVTGVVTSDSASGEPTIPRARVVVADRLRDDVGPIPAHVRVPERSRPALRLVPDLPVEDEPADPAAVTAQLQRATVIERTPRKGTPWITAGAVVFTVATVLSFAPPADVATQLTTGLAVLPTFEVPAKPMIAAAAPEAVERVESVEIPVSPDASRLDAALAEGRIRELDLLFVTSPYATDTNWRGAATRCRARSVNGVRGWRLPRVDELRKLWRHQLLPATVFWTSARAPTAAVPSNQAFDATVPRVVPLAKDERAGTICVRQRPR